MTEAELQLEILEKELARSQACQRLSANADFVIFRELMDQKLNEYRVLLEEQAENDRSNIVRGGISALKDVFNLFDAVESRREKLVEQIKELKDV